MVDAVKKQLNKPDLEVDWMPVTSQNRIPLVTNGTIDLECGSTTNNTARGKDVAFAINHFYTGTRLLVKKTSGIKNYADLAGKTGRQHHRHHQPAGACASTTPRRTSTWTSCSARTMPIRSCWWKAAAPWPSRMDDILLFGLMANAKNPADYEVVGDALQVEPYACMLRKDDPAFKKLVDGVIGGMMKSGEFEKLYTKWFMQPIPPKNMPLNLPMSPQLKENLKAPSDKPAT